MKYPKFHDFQGLIDEIRLLAQLKCEYGAEGIAPIIKEAEKSLYSAAAKLKKLPVNKELAMREPNDLESIRSLRPAGHRRKLKTFDKNLYRDRLEGALLGRMAGCTLGAPVEFWPIEKMQALADENGDPFPPRDYWSYVPEPKQLRYGISPREAYTQTKMNGVPVDDDIAYTLLGLLVIEENGANFKTEDIGLAWLKYLPIAYTAEDIALRNLKSGLSAAKAAEKNNPYCEWIGASIRADPWGYLAPGCPEMAAEMAYRDAYISHRRQGIYASMFFAATIAAAFSVDNPLEALNIGLCEIPKSCALAKAVRWALNIAPEITNYRQARDAVTNHFNGMSMIHAVNNACLTVFGIGIGGTDLTGVIGEIVAMGMDNDCTAATAGSIVGAVIGKQRIPEHWYRNFNNTVHSYLTGKPSFEISELVNRFTGQAEKIMNA